MCAGAGEPPYGPLASRSSRPAEQRGAFCYFDKDLFHITRELGYRTALVGKNHSHLTPERVDFWRPYMHSNGYIPNPAPKDYVEFDRWMSHLNHGTGSEATPFPLEVQFPYRIISDAIEFVDSREDQPFAMWVSFPEPHNPYQVPKPYFDMFPPHRVPARDVGPEALRRKGFKWNWLRQLENSTYPGYDDQWRRTRSNYLGMLRLIDDQIDRLLNHLKSTAKLENTIVVYLTDHGDFFCDYGLIRKGVDLPEVLTRIPMVWSGWGIHARTAHPAFVSTADVLPTLCEAIGASMPVGTQGRSLWPLLQGRDYPQQEFESIYSETGFGGMDYGPGDEIEPRTGKTTGSAGAIPTFDELNSCTQSGNMKMVRWGDWKLTFNRVGAGELFNVAKDPYELNNLYAEKRAAPVRERLTAELLRWTIRTQDDLPVAAYRAKWPKRNWDALYRNKG